ncbi:MAG: hypothetical protein JXM75_07820 [Chromatiaceae bacterium]|nr:hypothetical protein [Chromatiaceae bacterium]
MSRTSAIHLRRIRLFALVLGVGLLAGCGFQLRGEAEIPLADQPLYIEAPAGSALRAALDSRLAGSPVRQTEARAEAGLILRILAEERAARVAAVDRNGKALAYELHYGVRFDALDADGRARVAPQSMDLVRNFANPDVEVLGKRLEEAMLYQDFAVDAADRLLMRLRAALR